MLWISGIGGFVIGFAAGLYILKIWLKDKSREELMMDKSLHVSYGGFVWLIAAIGAAMGVYLYRHYF